MSALGQALRGNALCKTEPSSTAVESWCTALGCPVRTTETLCVFHTAAHPDDFDAITAVLRGDPAFQECPAPGRFGVATRPDGEGSHPAMGSEHYALLGAKIVRAMTKRKGRV